VTFRLVEPIHGDIAPFLLGGSLAHTVLHGAYANEVHFNKELLSDSGISKRDAYRAALHEVGHVIGVSHSADERSVMYPIRIKIIRQEILPSDVEAFYEAEAANHERTR
jgi:predicted Zn-dependent protease